MQLYKNIRIGMTDTRNLSEELIGELREGQPNLRVVWQKTDSRGEVEVCIYHTTVADIPAIPTLLEKFNLQELKTGWVLKEVAVVNAEGCGAEYVPEIVNRVIRIKALDMNLEDTELHPEEKELLDIAAKIGTIEKLTQHNSNPVCDLLASLLYYRYQFLLEVIEERRTDEGFLHNVE